MRKVVAFLIGAVVATGVLVLGGAREALAGCAAPTDDNVDGRIRKAGGDYVGDGVYNCSQVSEGNPQFVPVNRLPGKSVEFEVRFRNDEAGTEDLRLFASEPEPGDPFKVAIFRGSKDITAAMQGGAGKLFRDVPADESTKLVRVRSR